MSLHKRLILPLLTAGAMTLCAPISAEEVIATVNGSSITKEDFQRFAFEATQGVKGNPKLDPNDVLNELLSRELIYQDALKQGIDKRKDVEKELAHLKHKLVVSVALDEATKKNPVSDKEMQQLYDKEIKNLKLEEFKARHIMVAEKTLAEQIITELDVGGDFAQLAGKHSIHAASKDKGGDLDWFSPQRMIPEVANTTMLLDNNKYTKVPVKSQYGWHIIKREGSRDVPTPSFDKVKPKLAQALQQKKVGKYIQALKAKADIKVNQP